MIIPQMTMKCILVVTAASAKKASAHVTQSTFLNVLKVADNGRVWRPKIEQISSPPNQTFQALVYRSHKLLTTSNVSTSLRQA